MRLNSLRSSRPRVSGKLTPSSRVRSARPVPRPSQGARAGLALLLPILLLLPAPARSATPARPAAAPPPLSSTELVRLRYWTAPEHTRLVFDLSGAAPSSTRFRLVDSLTFEIYMPGVRKSPAVTTEFVGDSLVADIFPSVSDLGTSVRVHLKRMVTPLGFVLAAADGVPDRVVVDIPMPVNPDADQALQQHVTELKSTKNFIVAIDAGH